MAPIAAPGPETNSPAIMDEIRFKTADTAEEIEQIHRLNHEVFAEEVGQHRQTPERRLIDKFHQRNRYFIATKGSLVVGMISVHDGPDFSVESRLKDVSVLRAMRAPLEVRLLAIRPEFRKPSILLGLLWQVWKYAAEHQYSDLVISGIVERVRMYQKLGFAALGEAVPCGKASFVPMRLRVVPPPLQVAAWVRLCRLRFGPAAGAHGGPRRESPGTDSQDPASTLNHKPARVSSAM